MNNKLELTPARAELLLKAINDETMLLKDLIKNVQEERDNIDIEKYPNLVIAAMTRVEYYGCQLIELDFMRKFIVQYLEESNAKS